MTIHKCDICKKQLSKRDRQIDVSVTQPWRSFELCLSCAKQILDFLKKKNLIKDEED